MTEKQSKIEHKMPESYSLELSRSAYSSMMKDIGTAIRMDTPRPAMLEAIKVLIPRELLNDVKFVVIGKGSEFADLAAWGNHPEDHKRSKPYQENKFDLEGEVPNSENAYRMIEDQLEDGSHRFTFIKCSDENKFDPANGDDYLPSPFAIG